MARGSLGDRIVHGLIAATQLLPIIGQISSISEKLIVDHYLSRVDLQGRNMTDETSLEEHSHVPRPVTKKSLIRIEDHEEFKEESSSSESLTSSSSDSDEDASTSTSTSVSSSSSRRISFPPLASDSTTSDDDDDLEQLLEELKRLHLSHEVQNYFDDLRSDNGDKLALLEQIRKQIPNWPEYLYYLAKHQTKDFNLLFSVALESTIPEIYMEFIRVLDQADFNEHLASLNNCQIIFGNQVLLAHSTVLRHISPYFDKMFSSGLREAQTNIIHLPEQDYELFEKLLPNVINVHFFDQSLGLSGDTLIQYLYLAEKYQFPLIKEACEEWVLANFENIEMDPRDLFNLADQYHLESIKSKMVHGLIQLYLTSAASQPQKILLKEWLPKMRFLDLSTYSSSLHSSDLEPLLKLCTEVGTLQITLERWDLYVLKKTLSNLRNLELTLVRLDDETIEHPRGLPISWLEARCCGIITSQGFAYLKDLSLKSLHLKVTDQITDQWLANLKDLPLKSFTLRSNDQITDQGLTYLKDLPLKSLTLGAKKITDQGLANLKDLSLKSLSLEWNDQISDKGLTYLKDLPLESLMLNGLKRVTDQGLVGLKDLPLKLLIILNMSC